MASYDYSDNNEASVHYYSEARILAFAESNPVMRLELLQVLIEEGDVAVTEFAMAALKEQQDMDPDDPQRPNVLKTSGARALVETLAHQGLFEDAENVVDLLGSLDQKAAIVSIITLLQKGYAGQDNRFLTLDFMPLVQTALAKGHPPETIVFNYLEGLASYGADLFDNKTVGGHLLPHGLSAVPRAKRDYYYNSLAYSFANGDHLDKAMIAKDHIHDPYWRSLACVELGKIAQAQGNVTVTDLLVSEAHRLLNSVRYCAGSCGRAACNPTLDTKTIEVGMALISAKQGQQALAHELVGSIEPALAYNQAVTHTELYKTTGGMSDRTAALTALAHSSVFDKPSSVEALITDLAIADWQWGNVIPSLDTINESLPLICWELHSIYELEASDLSKETYQVMEILNIDPLTFVDDIAEKRQQMRDHGLTNLIRLLISTGAPKTARSLLGLIETPVEKVRTLYILGVT